ncbi:glycoside hydrolase domain-containing protein [Vibrio coralliilyticus]|uniref:glycoside hydrolase domain-containing protein n=1 Tax=Vibrio coralliilyticus TaxID=190893 RepID=UPI002FD1FE99
MPKMIDASCDTTSNIEALKKAGVTHVGRYYNNGDSPELPTKCLTKTEATALSRAGLHIVVVFQKAQNTISDFNSSEGGAAALQALQCAADVGQPLGSVIYFAVDFNANTDQVNKEISCYFTSVNKILDGKFEVGVYGSGMVCTLLYEAGLCQHRWLSCSTSYEGTEQAIENSAYDIRQLTMDGTKACSGQQEIKGAKEIYQVTSNKIGTLSVDYDELGAVGAVGAFRLGVSTYRVNVSATSYLKLHEAPSLSSPVIGKLVAGQVVTKLSTTNDWDHIETDDGQKGYASAKYLERID